MSNQKYDLKKIGALIRSERKGAGFKSAENFGRVLNIGRSQVEQIERGERLPDLDTLVKMAEMFNCEIGYLLCEHPGKTKTATDIMAETGLSETAVDHLREIQKSAGTVHGGAKLMLLNAILEDEEFLENSANALYALHMIPEQTMIEISFYDERGKHNGNSLRSDNSDDLKRLYVADLQNIIFRFMESQLHI